MIPISIKHERLIALSTVVAMADKYVNITDRHPDFKLWEDHLKDARSVVERLREVHIRDARENGACEKCDPVAFERERRRKEHEAELQEFDKKLILCPVHSGNVCGCEALTAEYAKRREVADARA